MKLWTRLLKNINFRRASNPHGFADEPMGHRVSFVVKLDVMVGIDFGLFPLGHGERLWYQRFQLRLFFIAKGGIGLQMGGVVGSLSIVMDTPVLDQLFGLSHGEAGMNRQ